MGGGKKGDIFSTIKINFKKVNRHSEIFFFSRKGNLKYICNITGQLFLYNILASRPRNQLTQRESYSNKTNRFIDSEIGEMAPEVRGVEREA